MRGALFLAVAALLASALASISPARAQIGPVPPPSATAITVGSTQISGGTNGRVLYDNSGSLGELATTGSGNVVLSASPTITGSAVTFTSGTSRTLANAAEIISCTSTCTVTPPASATAGMQFCVRNANNVNTVITLAAVSGVTYEATARTSYGGSNKSMTSGGAVTDQICMVAVSTTAWNVFSYTGTWTNTP